MNREESELLVRVGPNTPMGRFMRRYWIPALLSDQIGAPDCDPVRVKLLGERLVAFRDSAGQPGLLGEQCPHRTASLFFGRNEAGGLRCVYHGWKFDVEGACLEMPSEPRGGEFRHQVRAKAYPCIERGGIVWTYMGPADCKPEFPDLEWVSVAPQNRYVSRHVQECNWLQALEGGFDSSHLGFLHIGSIKGVPNIIPSRYEVMPTDFGAVVGTGRELDDGNVEWSANVMLAPFHKLIATTPLGSHVWVPIDDENTMLYSCDYNPDRPFTQAELDYCASGLYTHTKNIPGTDRPIWNRDNDYLIDRALQRSGDSYTGIASIGMQDCAIQESMGPIADRSLENLGVSDMGIAKIRRFLLNAVRDHEAGGTPPGMNGASYRVRSARFRLPASAGFAGAVDQHVRQSARQSSGVSA